MKKTIILSVLIALSATVVAQNDTSGYMSIFGDSSTMWFILEQQNYSENHPDDYGSLCLSTLKNDTVNVNGQCYYVLRNDNSWSFWVYYWPYDNWPQYIRESEDHSKVYFKENFYYWEHEWEENAHSTDSLPEILIMDLDLEIGDTLETTNWTGLIYFHPVVPPTIRIDSIYYIDGHKVLQTNYIRSGYGGKNDTLLFIEGIGPSFGPLYAGYRKSHTVICYYTDDIWRYHNSAFDNSGIGLFDSYEHCWKGYQYGSINTNEESGRCIVYPNPAADRVTVAAEGMERVELIGVDGTVLLRKDCRGECQIDLTGLAAGLYLVRATTPRGTATRRLVVQ